MDRTPSLFYSIPKELQYKTLSFLKDSELKNFSASSRASRSIVEDQRHFRQREVDRFGKLTAKDHYISSLLHHKRPKMLYIDFEGPEYYVINSDDPYFYNKILEKINQIGRDRFLDTTILEKEEFVRSLILNGTSALRVNINYEGEIIDHLLVGNLSDFQYL